MILWDSVLSTLSDIAQSSAVTFILFLTLIHNKKYIYIFNKCVYVCIFFMKEYLPLLNVIHSFYSLYLIMVFF